MKNLKEQFEEYLISLGYSVETPKRHPSTVYDYCKRVERVCSVEKLTWESLAEQIDFIVSEYDIGGIKENDGKKSHNAVINALKRYCDFIKYKQIEQ